jgi:hypothetical protein
VSRRTASWLAWSLCVLFVLVLVATAWESSRGDRTIDVFVFAVLGYAVVGALVASRRPGNPVGWLLLAVALTFAAMTSGEIYVVDPTNPARQGVGWLTSWMWLVWVTLVAVFLPLEFPDGRLPSPRWRLVGLLGGAGLALTVFAAGVKPGDLALNETVRNPFGVHGAAADLAAIAGWIGAVLIGAAAVLAAISLVLRFRRARGVDRSPGG